MLVLWGFSSGGAWANLVIMIQDLIQHVSRGQSLDRDQALAAVNQLIDSTVAPEVKADFLSALTNKGETTEEISVIASALRDQSISPPGLDQLDGSELIDVCGTGGDHLNTFNISTTVSLLLAAFGVRVTKHGNRAITSKSGSADVLAALGVPVDLTPGQAVQSLAENNFAFFFAIHYHPAFRHIGPARKICAERGHRTIFNFLGPLLNPARPTCQLIGVPQPERCEMMAGVLKDLGVRRGMVVSGRVDENRFMDEFSTLDNTLVAEYYQNRGFSSSEFEVSHLELSPVNLDDLAGGDAEHNAGIIESILTGRETGPKLEIVLLNTSAALLVADKCQSITEGWGLARDIINSGRASEFLAQLRSWKPD